MLKIYRFDKRRFSQIKIFIPGQQVYIFACQEVYLIVISTCCLIIFGGPIVFRGPTLMRENMPESFGSFENSEDSIAVS